MAPARSSFSQCRRAGRARGALLGALGAHSHGGGGRSSSGALQAITVRIYSLRAVVAGKKAIGSSAGVAMALMAHLKHGGRRPYRRRRSCSSCAHHAAALFSNGAPMLRAKAGENGGRRPGR